MRPKQCATSPVSAQTRIRSELGGLMAPGYHATGYTPRKVERVTLDDPTGDDIAGDVE
jgi:hypothetical protein